MTKWFSQNRVVIIRWAGTLLAVLLLLVLIREEKWDDILLAVRQVSLKQFLLALALMVVSRLFVVGRWHVLMRSGGANISVKDSAALTFTGLFASNFLPTTVGGDLARLAGAMQLGFDRAICLASLVADRLIGMLGMVFALPFGLLPFMKSLALVPYQAIAVTPFFQKILDFIRRTLSTFSIWFKKPLALLLSLGFTLGNMAFIFAAIYVLTSGLGRDVSYWLIAGLWSMTYFVTLVPISINGFGVQEFSLTYLLAKLGGLDHAQSVTIAVLIRLLFILASTPGAVYLPSIMSAMNRNPDPQIK
ncbi:MAG: flippase-like domain-containing protein [Chloroflexi bacterium]|nr:flippase-like domain-containing protein [Chloroflexota bacterium]